MPRGGAPVFSIISSPARTYKKKLFYPPGIAPQKKPLPRLDKRRRIRYIFYYKPSCRARCGADGQKENARIESEVFDRIREYLADQLDVDPDKITPDSDIVEDFGADSLDVVDMITTLSDEFGVDIPDEEIENFHTVGDVVQYVEDRM